MTFEKPTVLPGIGRNLVTRSGRIRGVLVSPLAADVICVLFYCTCTFERELLNIHYGIVEERKRNVHACG